VCRRLLLWDVDGTMILGGGVGSEALYGAVGVVPGLPTDRGPVFMHGKTDPQILAELFAAASVPADAIPDLLPAAMAEAERLMALSADDLRRRGEVLPGVVAALSRLAEVPGVCQTLVTGNLAGNAAVKLAAFELTRFFDVEIGAYGSDRADRNELVPVALDRAGALRGERYRPSEVWVIGDTPADYACAQAAGVRCLLVGTGQVPMQDLVSLGADAVLPDLTRTDDVVQILTA